MNEMLIAMRMAQSISETHRAANRNQVLRRRKRAEKLLRDGRDITCHGTQSERRQQQRQAHIDFAHNSVNSSGNDEQAKSQSHENELYLTKFSLKRKVSD
jgi:hypothetical protein